MKQRSRLDRSRALQLAHRVGASTIRRILKRHRIPRALVRHIASMLDVDRQVGYTTARVCSGQRRAFEQAG
jgi:hypothetical protein